MCNGVLVGFVAITAGAHVLEPWAAILDGALAALVFEAMAWVFLYKWGIDDPLSAAPMHAFGGAGGVLFVGLLAKQVSDTRRLNRASFFFMATKPAFAMMHVYVLVLL